MNKEQLIKKYEEKISFTEINKNELFNKMPDVKKDAEREIKKFLEFIDDIKKLDLSDVIKSVCPNCNGEGYVRRFSDSDEFYKCPSC